MADRDRINSYLQNIAEGESAFDDPRTEEEVFLANIANGDENTRHANTREEYWLKQIEVGSAAGTRTMWRRSEGRWRIRGVSLIIPSYGTKCDIIMRLLLSS